MKTTLIMAFVAALFVLSITASAQGVEKVILATDITSVDALVASAAGSKDGLPVLILPAGELTDDIKAELASLNPATVVIVGGPLVVKPAAEDELRDIGYKVVRLWGLERTETAIEIATHFWPEGVNCTVLVDDTKDPAVDTNLLTSGAADAAQSGCMMLPIPKGKVPATVLTAMRELGVKRAKWFGRAVATEVRTALSEFNTTEVIGEDAAETEAENETIEAAAGRSLKLVIVAAPNWTAALGVAAHPNERAVVRILSSANVTELVTLIQQKNITDVKVVGFPALAQEIATALTVQGVNVTKISGERASDVAKAVLERVREQWTEKRAEVEAKFADLKTRIKAKIEVELNDTEAELDQEGEELEQLGINATATASTDIATLKQRLATAKTKFAEVRAALAANDTETAKELLADLRETFQQAKWLVRERIKWNWQSELEDEEADTGELETKLNTTIVGVRVAFAKLSERCPNAELVHKVVEEARALMEAAKNATADGEHGKAAEFLELVKKHVETAKSIGEVCKERGNLTETAREIIRERRAAIANVTEVSTEIAEIEQKNATEIETEIEQANLTIGAEAANGAASNLTTGTPGNATSGQGG